MFIITTPFSYDDEEEEEYDRGETHHHFCFLSFSASGLFILLTTKFSKIHYLLNIKNTVPLITYKITSQDGRPMPKNIQGWYRGVVANAGAVAPITAFQMAVNGGLERLILAGDTSRELQAREDWCRDGCWRNQFHLVFPVGFGCHPTAKVGDVYWWSVIGRDEGAWYGGSLPRLHVLRGASRFTPLVTWASVPSRRNISKPCTHFLARMNKPRVSRDRALRVPWRR